MKDVRNSGGASRGLAAQIAGLPTLSMPDLWALWDQHFDARPQRPNRVQLEAKLAYRMQERAYGGLSPATRQKLERIGETGQLPQAASAANQVQPGTVLVRHHGGVEHRVTCHGSNQFDYNGKRYRSLSAIAREITGTQWSGPVFFGLKGRGGK